MNESFERRAKKVADFLETVTLSVGVGTEQQPCSIAAINLALFGELTDDIPLCMSEVIGKWVIYIQDTMPESIRNSDEWYACLPLATGTGRNHERERFELLCQWLYDSLLPMTYEVANRRGVGEDWKKLIDERKFSELHQKILGIYDKMLDEFYFRDAAPAGAIEEMEILKHIATDLARMHEVPHLYNEAVSNYLAPTVNAVYCLMELETLLTSHPSVRKFWEQVDPVATLKKLIEVSNKT